MNQRIRNALEDLEAARDNLLALSDDIWPSTDHVAPKFSAGSQFQGTGSGVSKAVVTFLEERSLRMHLCKVHPVFHLSQG